MVRDFVSSISKLLYRKRVDIRNKLAEPEWELQFRNEISDFKAHFDKIECEESTRGLVDDMLNKIVFRAVKTKIPVPPINYLDQPISDSDIDWLLKSIKEQWIRFNQIYWGKWIDNEIKNDYNKN